MAAAPKSLLQIAGAPLTPSPLDKSALVIIDAQLEYTRGCLPLDGVDSAIVEASKLLKLARERNIAVVTVESEKHPLIIEPTADFAYARLELTQSNEATGYPKADLKRWAKTARDWEKSGDVFLYFISGAKERNPAAAMAMLELLKA